MDDICVFLPVDYEGPPGRWRFLTAALAGRLVGKSKVLCVNRPICPIVTPIRHRKKLIRWLSELVKRSDHVRQITENLFVFTPFILLHDQLAARFPLLVRINRALLGQQMNRMLTRLAFHRSELTAVVYTPYQKDYIGIAGETFLIYDCYDEYTAGVGSRVSEGERHKIHRNELEIMKRADVVLIASQMLAEHKSKYHHNVHYVPNAVDVGLFQLAQNEEVEIAADILRVPHPIVGYTGIISERIDFELIEQMARLHPEWSLVFVGPVDLRDLRRSDAFERIKQHQNVFFLGERPYQRLPTYLKAFDVCILPYGLDRFNLSCSPLKLYEYLAAGKTLVSTDLPEVRPFHGLVRIARDIEEFERQLVVALEERDEALSQRRLATARENSWEKRAEQVLQIIDHALAGAVLRE